MQVATGFSRPDGEPNRALSGRTGRLTTGGLVRPLCAMATPNEENFNDYKRAEKKALQLLAEMKAVSPKTADIELALLVAIFELHKGTPTAPSVAMIVQGHLKQLVPYYAAKHPAGN